MEKIWNFFDNLNEVVYASDIDTNELVFMNKKALKIYGFNSISEIIGKKCFEIIRGSSTSCAMCNNHELKSGYFKEWQSYNPVLNKYYLIKNTLIENDGHKYRLEISIDISSQNIQAGLIDNYKNLETLVNEGMRLALSEPDPDKSINIILEYLGKALHGERTYIFERNIRGNDDNTYEWVASGITAEKDNLQDVPAKVCANWYKNFSINKNIIIEDLENIREKDPLQYDNLKRQSIHSLVVVPLYDDQKIIGFYGVDNPTVKSLNYASNMLQITGHFMISSLKRRNLMHQLEHMSYYDQLTGFGNRYAVNKYVSELQSTDSFGLVYCDITGLKHINDSEGHAAGDRFIQNACSSLKRVFGHNGLFRIGGDEFIVICTGTSHEAFLKSIDTLKTDMDEHSVCMAVGYIWQDNTPSNIDKLLSESERLMYIDKDAYYSKHNIERRKY